MTDHNYQYDKNTTNNNITSSSSNETTTASSSSNTTTIPTRPGVCLLNPQDLEDIRISYKSSLGMELTATVAAYIERCLRAGMQAEVVVDAIERTGWARRPSPFYLRAILRRYLEWSIFTMEDVLDDQADREDFQRNYGDDRWKDWYKG